MEQHRLATVKSKESSSGATHSRPAQTTLRDRLIGTWKMLSWTREITAAGETSDAFGAHPIGYINYGTNGRVIVLVVKSDRTAPRTPVATDREKLALFDSLLSYAGTYTVDDEKVIHHIDASWNVRRQV